MVQANKESKGSEKSMEEKEKAGQTWFDKNGAVVIGLSIFGMIALMGLVVKLFG